MKCLVVVEHPWVDKLVMRQPVKRQLKIALLDTCVPACEFEMASLYRAERLTTSQVKKHWSHVESRLRRWR